MVTLLTTDHGKILHTIAAKQHPESLMNKVVISIRINHPSWPLDRITSLMKCAPEIGRSVGEERRTPKGKKLDGKNPETHWIKSLKYKGDSLPDAIEKAISEFGRQSAVGREIRQSGGRVEFFIGWFFDKNGGDVLSAELLGRLADLGIDLSFDVYGPEVRMVAGSP